MPPRQPRTRKITPKQGLTPEAKAELNKQGIDTVSDIEAPFPSIGGDTEGWFAGQNAESENLYTEIPDEPDADIPPFSISVPDVSPENEDKPLIDPEKPERSDLRTGPPKADEWLDFFSRIVLKTGMELYTDFAFRGVDESKLSADDLERIDKRIKVRKEERDTIARPFAEYSTKNPFLRKHGRQVVAFTDSAESLITLGIWMRRVNRVAKQYKPAKPQSVKPQNMRIMEPQANGHNGYPQGADEGIKGFSGGRIASEGLGVFNPGGG